MDCTYDLDLIRKRGSWPHKIIICIAPGVICWLPARKDVLNRTGGGFYHLVSQHFYAGFGCEYY
jgi:hypothetical protein